MISNALIKLWRPDRHCWDIFHMRHVSFADAKKLRINRPMHGNYLLLKRNGDDGFIPDVPRPLGTHTVLWAGLFDHGLSQRLENPEFGHFEDPKNRLVDHNGVPVIPSDILFTYDDSNLKYGSKKAEFPPGSNRGFEALLHFLFVPCCGTGFDKSRSNGFDTFITPNQVDLKKENNRFTLYRTWKD
ncbi:hypothetical protein [Acetobacter pasteurianus]|uniref:hypothetical protein n=1 Tax=Acetobacter pasteurianus TaxID=438 RepID=UPI003D0984E1